MPDDGCRQSERHPFGFLRVDGPRVAFFGEPFLRVFVRAAFLIDSLDFALAEERFFGALRAFFAREAFFFVTCPYHKLKTADRDRESADSRSR
jgi:hypothetical protein